VDVWNQWREKKSEIIPDLSGEKFFQGANLKYARLEKTNFKGANLSNVSFMESNLSLANFSGCTIWESNFYLAYGFGIDLEAADLSWSDFDYADLEGANLRKSNIQGTIFRGTNIIGADFSESELGGTVFGDIDLSEVKGLETTKHWGHSYIDTHTLLRSRGKIPDKFLESAGISKRLIKCIRSLPNEAFYSCFISYSGKEEELAKRLYDDLKSKGIRCGFAPEDIKIGQKIRPAIENLIRGHDKLLLILCDHSINSEWIEDEVEIAYEKEKKANKIVLFPVKIDDAVMDTNQAWAAKLKRSRHIGDFRKWKDNDSYKEAFARLLRDLRAED
jgi:hypothetical protein